jgi:ApbE superfamily uncharacterized protein (UPF0280 family)
MKHAGFQPRTYRQQCRRGNLVGFRVVIGESDLLIMAQKDLAEESRLVLGELRCRIQEYAAADPDFITALAPRTVPDHAPAVVRDMAAASAVFGVGPMAAVAGAISESVARHLAQYSDEVIVENGGDDFLISSRPVTTAIYAGSSPLSMKLGIEVSPRPEGISICTSSGMVGHSLSFGSADAVTVIARSGCIADAAATAVANRIMTEADIGKAIEFARGFPDILGLVIIKGEAAGIYGDVMTIKSI